MKQTNESIHAKVVEEEIVTVNQEDQELIRFNWYIQESPNFDITGKYNVVMYDPSASIGHRRKMLGRVIMERTLGRPLTSNEYVIHRNLDSSDYTRNNLKVVTKSEVQHTRYSARGSTSKYKGVSWDKATGMWIVSIRNNGKPINLGRYRSEHRAAEAYNIAAKCLFDGVSRINNV